MYTQFENEERITGGEINYDSKNGIIHKNIIDWLLEENKK